jgi:hypothetical protein
MFPFKQHLVETVLVNSVQTSGIRSAHSPEYRNGQRPISGAQPPLFQSEKAMNIFYIIGVVVVVIVVAGYLGLHL